MDTTTPREAVEPESRRDLRAELYQNLSTQFAAALDSNGSLPTAARMALVELLDSDAPTATEIIAAVSKSDPVETKVGDE
jgi:hypothetical protein